MTCISRTLGVIVLLGGSVLAQGGSLGVFTHAADVGAPAIQGSTQFNAATGEYSITGAGANMWARQDQFQYVYREMTGNFTVSASIRFLGTGAPHRKGGIVVREGLDTDAKYAGVMIHGDGMPALQWRSAKGDITNTFNLPFDGPGTFNIKLVRNGVRIYMHVGKNGATPQEVVKGEVSFQGPVLVGLGVTSHDAAAKDTLVFSNVQIDQQ
jgi:TolB protein